MNEVTTFLKYRDMSFQGMAISAVRYGLKKGWLKYPYALMDVDSVVLGKYLKVFTE